MAEFLATASSPSNRYIKVTIVPLHNQELCTKGKPFRLVARSRISEAYEMSRSPGALLGFHKARDMDAIGPALRTKALEELRPIAFDNWIVDEAGQTVFHQPYGLAFLIDYAPPDKGKWLGLLDHTARLAHACDDTQVPAAAELVEIMRDAIHVFALLRAWM